MKNEILKQIIVQIKKYELTEAFSDVQKFQKWLLNLNNVQINNFLSLNIDLDEIREIRHLLINENLLNCQDYQKRVAAISTLKNGDGCWHLFNTLCKPNFLKSKNFYKDIEMLSKADTARYGLWILGEDDFINSPYHDEDLKLLIETHDTNKENPLDFVVSDALATVASNIDSIKSPFHRSDMKLMAITGSDCLQASNSYPEDSLNNLAIDKVSLGDKYHSLNMQILATNPVAREFLYKFMTDSNFVNGENYCREIEALVKAKSKKTARALYYYIVNPERNYLRDRILLEDYEYDAYEEAYISNRNSVAGSNDPNYLENLVKINKIDDKFVMLFVSLLMNPDFINSPYKDFDLELLQSVSSKSIFMDLCMLMTNVNSLKNKHHKKDAVIISQSSIDEVRDLLLKKASDEYSLNSSNHEFDMEYISRLNLNSIDKKIYSEIYYYLFGQKGIDDLQHKEKLEKLLEGELVYRNDSVASYLDEVQSQMDENVDSMPPVSFKQKSRILSLFKKKTTK